jgi:hypothetical protein
MSEFRFASRTLGGALAASLLVLSFGALAACKKKETTTTTTPAPAPYEPAPAPAPAPVPAGVEFRDAKLGKAVGADKMVTQAADTFAPKDTVYASVTTAGTAASAAIRALWTFQDGQVVSDDTQTITAGGADTTEFHISKPDGFPAGSYKVELFIDGRSVATRNFTVK